MLTHLNLRPLLIPALAIAFLFPPSGSLAQTTEDKPVESGLTEKVNVRLVEISVTARDRKGKPIRDLVPKDLRIKARGREMKVAFVEHAYEETDSEIPRPEVRLHLEAPGAFAPVAVTRAKKPHYFIFMIDVENDDKLLRPKALADISRFIVSEMHEGDFGAVISFNGKINIEVGFTGERGALTEAVSHAYSQAARPNITKRRRIEQLIDVLDECLVDTTQSVKTADEDCVRQTARIYAEELTPTSHNFIESLGGIVRYAGGLQGRATVFAISHGVVINPTVELFQAVRAVFGDTDQIARMQMDLVFGEGVRHETDKLVQLALQEGVTFYFVDRSSAPAGMAGARQQGFYSPGIDPVVAAYRQPQGDMGEVAGATGGEFIMEKSAYDGLERAMDGERGRYTVGFYVDELLNRKDLRKIRVKSKRRGVRINSGRGSYQQKRIRDSGIGEIRFGQTRVLEGEKKGRFIPFRILANPRLFGYERAGEAMVAQLTLHFTVETHEGLELTDSYHFLSHTYPARLWENGEEGQIVIEGWIEAPDGSFRLGAMIRNPKTGQGGRIVREIKVVSP